MTDPRLSRRSALKGLAAAPAFFGASTLLSACGDDSDAPAATGSATDPITFGSNYSDDATKQAFAALTSSATAATKVPISCPWR